MRRAALKILRRALKEGVDLREVALYHLVTMARESARLSMSMAAGELQKAGLERHDAAVIAVLLADQDSASSAMGLRKVRNLLASAQLSEARQALGTTRRVAVPLLEHLDRRGWTRRVDATHRTVVRPG